MEDLTFGYNKACVMDIKMGTRTYAEDSNLLKKKIRQMKDLDTTSARYGIRITGYRTFNSHNDQIFELTKECAEKVTTIEMLERHLEIFFMNGTDMRFDVIKYYLEKLNFLSSWMETQTHYRFFSSSILFIFDGAIPAFKADLRMIDFAHVHDIKDNGTDTGYSIGLKNLTEILQKFLHLRQLPPN